METDQAEPVDIPDMDDSWQQWHLQPSFEGVLMARIPDAEMEWLKKEILIERFVIGLGVELKPYQPKTRRMAAWDSLDGLVMQK